MDLSMASSPFVEIPRDPINDEENRTPLRLRRARSSANEENKHLEEQIQTLKFELETMKNERQHEALRHENEIRSLEKKFQQEGKRADELESDQVFLFNKQKETADTLLNVRDQYNKEKAEFESNIQHLRIEVDRAVSKKDDLESELRSHDSLHRKQIDELQMRNTNTNNALESVKQELCEISKELFKKQNVIVDQEQELTLLRSESTRLKSSMDQMQSVDIVQRELEQHVAYVHKLEDQIAEQQNQLKEFRESKQVVEVIMEEKDSLQARLLELEDTREQLNRLELQNMELLQQKDQWRLFLEKDDNFNSPQEVVRALMTERIEKVQLLDKLGLIEAEMSSISTQNINYVNDLSKLKADLQATKASLDKEIQARIRFQRQKELSSKEIAFLKEQLNAYENEESTIKKDSENQQKEKSTRVLELETLVGQLKSEISKLSQDLSQRDGLVATLQSPKRPAPTSTSEELLAESQRKLRSIQVEFDKLQVRTKELEKENGILQHQNKREIETNHRILELKGNPTAKHEGIKVKRLEALKKENEDLLNQINRNTSSKNLVPISTLDRVRDEMKETRRSLAEQEKRMERLKTVFSKKSLEIRECVNSLLGYKIDMLPNKKVRATSIHATSDELSFTFVPDHSIKNKFIGLDENPALQEFENLITFWIKERNDIPCFLAAINLELYDRTTKATRF